MKTSLCAAACVAASWMAAESKAVTQEQLDLEAKRQARSVHLGWTDVPDGSAFFNEVQVRESVPGTYFCVIGFQMGYFGIQELTDGKKVVIFSVWEPPNPVNADDPGKTEAARRTQLVYQGDGVRVGRFGGEGTGGQSFFDYPWRLNETYRFVVHAKPAGDRNPVMTVNAGLRDDWFFLETGGGVTNLTPLHTVLRRTPPVAGLSFE